MMTAGTINTSKMMAHTMASELNFDQSAVIQLAACLMEEIGYDTTARLLLTGHSTEIIVTTKDSLEACLEDAQRLVDMKEDDDDNNPDELLAWQDRLDDDEKVLNVLKEICGY